MHEATSADALDRRGVSAREREVLTAVAEHRSNTEIAALLGLSERTVETHVSSLLRKLGVAGRRNLEPFARAEATARRLDRPAVPLQLQRLCEDGPWFGREAELGALLAQWTTASETRVVVVRGEAGIGKSRLVAELAVEVHRRGGVVALGACVDGAQRPFEPFVSGLHSVGVALEQDGVLARLLEATGSKPGTDVDPERERFRVQAALVDSMINVAGPTGLLFIVEDLHWASEAAREVFEVVARAPRRSKVLVVGTTRNAPAQDRYAAFLGRLARSPGVTTLSLTGLDLDAATKLITAERSALDPADGISRSGGNPLFLRQLARHGASSRSMGETVADLFTRLEDGDLDIVDAAVACGDPIDVRVVAAASARSPDDVLDALERTEAIGIVRDGDRPGTFVFSHDVFRSGRYAMLTGGRRMRLHASIATALDRPDLGEHLLATVAHHASLAGPRFDATRAAELSRQAGDVAMRAADHGAAAEHYGRALESMRLDPMADDGRRLALAIDLGQAMMLSGQRDGEAILRRAIHDGRRRGDHVAVAAALTAMTPVLGGHSSEVFGDEFEAMVADTIDALSSSETGWRARLIGNLGVHLYLADDVERAAALLDEAVDLARATGDAVTLGRALMAYRWSGGQFAMEERIACGHELIELGERTGQDVFSLVGCQQLAWCHDQLGDRVGLSKWYAAAEHLVHGPDLEQLTLELSIAVRDGDLAEAGRITHELVSLEGRHGEYGPGGRASLNEIRGRLMAPDTIEAAMARKPAQRWWLEPLLARSLARTRQTDTAAEVLTNIRTRGYGPRESIRWTPAMSYLAETAALCADAEVAADVAELLEPLGGRPIHNGLVACDTVDRARALCMLTIGNAAAAAELARKAAEASNRHATPILRARELIVLTRADSGLGRPVDDALLREALAIARRTGARIIEHDARLLLGTATIHDGTALTLREREIIDHVAMGQTNRQVAHALQISEATVRKHLEAAFKKLGVSTRTAAVARASRTGH